MNANTPSGHKPPQQEDVIQAAPSAHGNGRDWASGMFSFLETKPAKLCLGGVAFSQLFLCVVAKGRERNVGKNRTHHSYNGCFYRFSFPTHSPWLLKQRTFFPLSV